MSLPSDDPDFERRGGKLGLFEQFGLAKRRPGVAHDEMSPVKLKMITRDLTCSGDFEYQRSLKKRDFEYWMVTYEPVGTRKKKENQIKVHIDQQCAENAIELAAKYSEIDTFMDTDPGDMDACVLKWGVTKMSVPVTDDNGQKTKTEIKQAPPLQVSQRA